VTASVVARPTFEILEVGFDVCLKRVGDLFLGPDSVVWAGWDANPTVNTGIRIDVKIGPLANRIARHNTIDRAHVGTATAAHTQTCNDMSHDTLCYLINELQAYCAASILSGQIEPEKQGLSLPINTRHKPLADS